MKKLGFIIILFLNLLFVFWWEQDAILKLRLWNNPWYYSGRMYCENLVNIYLDSPNPTSAIQVYLDYNKNEINPISWRENNLWPTYPLLPSTTIPTIFSLWNTGRVSISENSFNVSQRRNGLNWLIWTFKMTNKTWIINSNLSFYVINFSTWQTAGDSTISQVWWWFDLLSWVENLSINFQSWPCLIDNNPPIIQNINIANNAYRVNLWNITYWLNDISNTWYHYEISWWNYIPTTTKDNQYWVKLTSIENILSWFMTTHKYTYNDTDISVIPNWQTTRDGLNKWYNINLSPFSRFTRDKEEEITLTISWVDNLWNKLNQNITFNKPRAPFVRRAAKSDWDWNIWLSNPFFNQVPDKEPEDIYFVKKNIPEIKFAVVDDWAWVDSGSLSVTLRRWSVYGTILKTYNKSELNLSNFSTTYLKNNAITWSNNITHSNNFYVTLTGFGELPQWEQIFVVVSWTDLSPSKTRFTPYNTNFPDQVNYFSFFVKWSCEAMQCREDFLVINITWIDNTYTWEKLYVSGNALVALSWDTLFCGAEYTGFDIMSWNETLGFYSWPNLIISWIWFTTFLSGEILSVNLTKPTWQITAVPTFGSIPLNVDFTLSGIDYNRMIVKKITFWDWNEYIPNTWENTFSYTYSWAGTFTAKLELANKYDSNVTWWAQVNITVLGSCGNWIVENPEQCDTANFNGQSCSTFWFNTGNLMCNTCTISTANCSTVSIVTCGNWVREWSEVCDWSDFDWRICADYGYDDWYLWCTNSCTISTQTCTVDTPSWWGWGGWWWTSLAKDNCPGWDYTTSYYDDKCWTPPHAAATWKVETWIIVTPPIRQCTITNSPYWSELTNAFKRAFSKWITTVCPIEDANLKWLLVRKHMAKMISSFAIQVVWLNPKYYKKCQFNDIKNETTEMKYYMKLSCQLWLMWLQYDWTPDIKFNPNGYVTRAQFGAILSRLIRWNKYNWNPKNRYINHLKALQKVWIMKIIHTPMMKEQRWFVLIMLHRTFTSGILHSNSLSRSVSEILDSFFSK